MLTLRHVTWWEVGRLAPWVNIFCLIQWLGVWWLAYAAKLRWKNSQKGCWTSRCCLLYVVFPISRCNHQYNNPSNLLIYRYLSLDFLVQALLSFTISSVWIQLGDVLGLMNFMMLFLDIQMIPPETERYILPSCRKDVKSILTLELCTGTSEVCIWRYQRFEVNCSSHWCYPWGDNWLYVGLFSLSRKLKSWL